MLRRIMLSSLGLLVSVGMAHAGFGATTQPKSEEAPVENAYYMPEAPPQPNAGRYGVHPSIHQVIWGKKATPAGGCADCNQFGAMPYGYGPGYGAPQGYGGPQGCNLGQGANGGYCHPIFGGPVFQGLFGPGEGFNPGGNAGPGQPAQGTLVFPNHPYARSPRDWYMYDARR